VRSSLLILLLVACGSNRQRPADSGAPAVQSAEMVPAAPGGASFTIASYNINAGMSGNPETLAALRRLKAIDVIVLQEVSKRWKRVFAEVFAESHPHRRVIVANRGYGGLAIASRFPIRSADVLPAFAAFPAWRGVIEAPGGAVQVLNVHLFPPGFRARKQGWLRAYRDTQDDHIRELAGFWPSVKSDLPTVIVGDFNENALGRAIAWLRERGFAPAHTDGTATWRWEMRGVPIQFQLDHIMVKGLDVVAREVRNEGASDHLPIVATVRLSRVR